MEKTPSKSRPYHIPVLVNEVLEYLDLKPNGVYVDATFGGGGHTRAILEQEPTCQVIAMDWDLLALEMNGEPLAEEFPDRITLVWGNFTLIGQKLKKAGFDKVDGVLADFGTSQHQLIERAGFSFAKDTPLDMRMSPGHQKVTAAHVLNKASEGELTKIFNELADEHKARPIARLVVEERKKNRFRTTKQLVQIVEKVHGPERGLKIHPATKVFQALRIYVNKELQNIINFLPAALKVLKPGGNLVCISFHSLEDRIVKHYFKREALVNQSAQLLTPKVVLPTKEEVKINPASRSARLRAIKLTNSS